MSLAEATATFENRSPETGEIEIMSTTTATRPEVEVDTAIANAWEAWDKARTKLANAKRVLSLYESRPGVASPYDLDRVEELAVAVDNARAELEEAEASYGGWSRFFIVKNSNGHIHSTMSCHTCFPTTPFGWLPELSGLDEAAAVEEWGEILCSVCFPTAPVEWTNGTNKKEREQRELEQALRAIAKSPEGKKVKSSGELVERKLQAISQAERALLRDAEDAAAIADGVMSEPVAWVVRAAARADAELPKLRKQLDNAVAKHDRAVTALEEALS